MFQKFPPVFPKLKWRLFFYNLTRTFYFSYYVLMDFRKVIHWSRIDNRPWVWLTAARALVARDSLTDESAISRSIASLSELLFFGGTSSPVVAFVINAWFSGISVVMTGTPAAIASRIAFDWPSKSVGSTKRWESFKMAGTSFRRPRSRIESFERKDEIIVSMFLRSSPSPTSRSLACGNSGQRVSKALRR